MVVLPGLLSAASLASWDTNAALVTTLEWKSPPPHLPATAAAATEQENDSFVQEVVSGRWRSCADKAARVILGSQRRNFPPTEEQIVRWARFADSDALSSFSDVYRQSRLRSQRSDVGSQRWWRVLHND